MKHAPMHAVREAEKNGTLIPWIIEHLGKEEKNANLLRHIQDATNVKPLLLDYPLMELKRIEGPQNDETDIEHVDEWNRRVKAFEHAFQNGFTSPPLIVTDFWGKIEIADGNHRHEALINSGYKTYWTIFLFAQQASLDAISKKQKK